MGIGLVLALSVIRIQFEAAFEKFNIINKPEEVAGVVEIAP